MKPAAKPSMSRRRLLKNGAVAAVTGGATLLGAGHAFAAQGAPATGGGVAGRRYRAFMRTKTGPATIQEVTLLPLDPMRIVVRTDASMCCYSDTGRALGLPAAANGQGAFNQPTILGHGGLGVVEAIGSMVKRVQVGDRVMVPNTAQCGECYNCLRGRADQCLLNGQAPEPVAQLADGTPVVQWNNEGGYSELMVPYENRVVPLFTRVPSTELAVLHCSGACGLGATMTLAPIELIAESVVKNRGEGDLCPVHRVVLRVVTLPVDYGLPDRGHAERCARFPFAGNMAWGGCTEGPERAVEVLRCDACSVGDRELFVQARRKPD